MEAYFLQRCIFFATSSYNIIFSIIISSLFSIACSRKSYQLYVYYFPPFIVTSYYFCRSSTKYLYLLHLFPCYVFSDSKYYHLLFHTGILHNQGYPLQTIFHCCWSCYGKKSLTTIHTETIVTIVTTIYWNHCYYRYYRILSLFWESSIFHFPNVIAPAVYATMATRYLLLVLLLDQLIFVHIKLQPLF